jgi:hypothetical protein
MGVELNHIIIWAKDKWASAEFLARVLGIQAGPLVGAFRPGPHEQRSHNRLR